MKDLTKVIFLAGALLAMAFTASVATHNNKNSITTRQVSDFNSLKVTGFYSVHLIPGNNESIKIDAPDLLEKNIITEVRNKTLFIYERPGKVRKKYNDEHSSHAIYVYLKTLSEISVAGSADIHIDKPMNAKSLSFNIEDSGDIFGEVNCGTLTSHIKGDGDITIKGSVARSIVEIKGSGNFFALDLLTSSTIIRVDGSGFAQVNAVNKLSASIHGDGDITYSNVPKVLDIGNIDNGNVYRITKKKQR